MKISGYNSYSKQGNFNHRYHGGVATYLHESLPVEHINIVSKSQVVVVKVNIRKNMTITVANIYIPGSVELEQDEICRMIDLHSRPVVIVGVFNAHNTVWDNSYSDRRGGC